MSRSIPTVGPRPLPAGGWARVWIDTGSGPGCVQDVRCDRLTLAEIDDGEGDSAIYDLHFPRAEVADAATGAGRDRPDVRLTSREIDS